MELVVSTKAAAGPDNQGYQVSVESAPVPLYNISSVPSRLRGVLLLFLVLFISADLANGFLRSYQMSVFGTSFLIYPPKHKNDITFFSSSGKQQQLSFSTWALWMGKGDGKRKRKKSSSPTPSAPPTSAPAPAPAPMRVTSDSNIPVKQQMLWAKLNKRYREQQSPSFRQKKVVRSRFRKVWTEEEMEEKALERKRNEQQEPDCDGILTESKPNYRPLVIVDGYNIIHKWAKLQKHMRKGDPARARELLVDDLENLASIKGWRIEVVFDGSGRSTTGPLGLGPGQRISNNNNGGGGIRKTSSVSALDKKSRSSVSKYGVRVVYSGVGMEADSYIEARCAQAKKVTKGILSSYFIVATDDAMIRLAGQSAGAWCMSADHFVTELKAVKDIISYRLEVALAEVNGHAIRPDQQRGTMTLLVTRNGRNSFVIVDKRNRTKTTAQRRRQQRALLDSVDLNLESVPVVEKNGIPWRAQLPQPVNQS